MATMEEYAKESREARMQRLTRTPDELVRLEFARVGASGA